MSLFGEKIDVQPLLDRLRALETTVEGLQRERKALDLEFTELYDKVSHQMSRMAKRHATANKNNGVDTEPVPENEPYAHLDPISRSIMLRRSGVRGEQ